MLNTMIRLLIFTAVISGIYTQNINAKSSGTYYNANVQALRDSGVLRCPTLQTLQCNNTELEINVRTIDKLFLVNCTNQRQFLFSTAKINDVSKIWDLCCKYNMIPATINSAEELLCLRNGLKSKINKGSLPNNILNRAFYTAQMDINLNGTFTSCITGEPLIKSLWDSGEPNNYDKNEACIAINAATMRFWDVECQSKDANNYFICENKNRVLLDKYEQERTNKMSLDCTTVNNMNGISCPACAINAVNATKIRKKLDNILTLIKERRQKKIG